MNTELDEMRQQMTLLKDKLNRQQIVNEQLVRDAIKGKISNFTRMRRSKRIWFIACIFFMPPIIVKVIHLPVWFAGATALLFILSFFYREYYMEGIDDHDLSSNGLLQVSQRATRLKRQTRRWLWFGIPMLLLWVLTFIWLVKQDSMLLDFEENILQGLITGLFFGAILGYIMYRRQQRMVDDLQDAINDLQAQE